MNHQKYQAIGEKIKRKRSRLWPVFATLLFVSGCIMYLGLYSHQKPVNVIFMISDGFGPASQTFARNYYQAVNGLPNNTKLPLDTILIGSSRTRSGNSLVTDSAAGATAFSCGIKTFNGAIGVDLSLNSCKTVLEDASANGILTGLVVTSRITHATPASFAAHVPDRDMESAIATQMIGLQQYGQSVDLMFGGGECFFLPNTSVGSCRKDDQDVYKQASELGFNVHRGIDAFNSLDSDSKLPLLNLFSKDHMDFEIDRAMQPSLLDMTKKAIAILESSPSSKKGYFLMIEGSRIDMAAHTNDPAAHLHEILMYNSVIEYVKGYVKKTNTVMVSTSDHETGGLSLGYQPGIPYPEYKWNPLFLKNIKKSSEYLAKKIANATAGARQTVITDLFKTELNLNATEKDIAYLNAPHTFQELSYYFARIASDGAQIGWSTHGHSAVDVNLYGYGKHIRKLKGNIENTDIYGFIRMVLGLPPSPIK